MSNINIANFKIVIVKCSQPMFWYANKIGQEFSVIDTSSRDYYVMNNNSLCSILVIDAELVKEKTTI